MLATAVLPAGRARAALSEGSPGPQDARPSRVLAVGPGRDIAKIASAALAARDGDIVEIDAGNYVDEVAVWPQSEITIRSAGGPVCISSVARTAEGASPQVALAAGGSSAFDGGAVVRLVAVARSLLLRRPAVVAAPPNLSAAVAPLAQDAPVLATAGEATERR